MTLKAGFYTVVQGSTHLTFHIGEIKTGNLQGKVKIGFLSGTNNETNYTYFGFVNGNFVNVWKKFEQQAAEDRLKRLRGAIAVLKQNPDEAGRQYALDSGLCYRCGRMLTNPESIKNGIGPECARK